MQVKLIIISIIVLVLIISGCTQTNEDTTTTINETTTIETTAETTIQTTIEETTTTTLASYYNLSITNVNVRVNSGTEGYEDIGYVDGQRYQFDQNITGTTFAVIEIFYKNTGQNKLTDVESVHDCQLYNDEYQPPSISGRLTSKYTGISNAVIVGNLNYIESGGEFKLTVKIELGYERGDPSKPDWGLNVPYELECTLRTADNNRNVNIPQKIENYFVSVSELH